MAAIPVADAFGNGTATAVTFAAIAGLDQAGGKNNRIGDLDDAARYVAGGNVLMIAAVFAVLAVEHLDIAFAAVEDDFFLEHAHTAYGGAGGGVPREYFNLNLKEEGQIAGIVSAVEGERFDVDVGGDHFDLPCAHADGVIDDHLVALCKEYAYVFQTIFVGAGIIDSARIDANRFFAVGCAAVVMGEFVFGHRKSSCVSNGLKDYILLPPCREQGVTSLPYYDTGAFR